jgi:uncharacterized membrane protein
LARRPCPAVTGGTGAAGGSFLIGLARAYAGAIIFSLPMLMTMEMWWLGFYIDPMRLALMLLLVIPLLIGLFHVAGFEDTFCWQDDSVDALVAYAVGFTADVEAQGLRRPMKCGRPIDRS